MPVTFAGYVSVHPMAPSTATPSMASGNGTPPGAPVFSTGRHPTVGVTRRSWSANTP